MSEQIPEPPAPDDSDEPCPCVSCSECGRTVHVLNATKRVDGQGWLCQPCARREK